MKKSIIALIGLFTLIACSEDSYQEADKMNESGIVDNGSGGMQTNTYTPGVGYESPFDINSVFDVPMKFVNNTTDYQIGYRVQVGPAYFDGNINGVIDYSPAGGPVLNSVNAPNLLYAGNEFNPALFVQYVLPINSGTSTTKLFSTFTASSPLNALEVSFLRKYGKVYSVFNYIYHNSNTGSPIQQLFLKGDAPVTFTSPTSIPTSMVSEGYGIVPGIQTYNPASNAYMGIVSFHKKSREVVYPPFANFRSEYTFTTSYGHTLHLYFKSYATHIEVVLEQ